MSGPTPGPWTLTDGVILAPDGLFIYGPHRSAEELAANARLIAAAPDLLIACQAALNDRMYKDWPSIADLLIGAIAKAEGQAVPR